MATRPTNELRIARVANRCPYTGLHSTKSTGNGYENHEFTISRHQK